MPIRPVHDRLIDLYSAPGPYVSVIVALEEHEDPSRGLFEGEREDLETRGASAAALGAVTDRLRLPAPEDAGGRAVFAASNGKSIAEFAPEGPRAHLIGVSPLPYVAPILEWDQWRLPHLAVVATIDGFDIIEFVPNEQGTVIAASAEAAEVAERCIELARADKIELIVIGGEEAPAQALRNRLMGALPIGTHVEVLEAVEVQSVAEFAAAVVRYVADRVARGTVQALEDFRFLLAHGGSFQGALDVLAALSRGQGALLIIHDDPDDVRTGWFGEAPTDVSLTETAACATEARLVDVAIRSALQQRLDVRIIPSTAATGPVGGIGLLAPSAEPQPDSQQER